MPRGSQAAAVELTRQERELAKTRAGECMWPFKVTPTGRVIRCGNAAQYIMATCELGVCSGHKRDDSYPIPGLS